MKRPCNHPGCSALLDKSGYCPEHKASAPKRHTIYNRHVRAKDPALALAHKIRKSAKWLQIRKQILGGHPLCADPHGDHARMGVTRTADQVHHIQPLVTHPELWNHADNLQPLCTGCHAAIERTARRAAQASPESSSRKPDATTEPGGDQKFYPFG